MCREALWRWIGRAAPQSCRSDVATPVGLEGRTLNQKLFSDLKISWNLLYWVLDLLDAWHSFLLSYFSFWSKDVYCMPLSSLCFGSTYLVWFHSFTARQQFCLKVNNASGLTHIWFWNLDVTLDLKLMLEWVTTLGAVGIQLMYLSWKKDIHFGIVGVESYGLKFCDLPKFLC